MSILCPRPLICPGKDSEGNTDYTSCYVNSAYSIGNLPEKSMTRVDVTTNDRLTNNAPPEEWYYALPGMKTLELDSIPADQPLLPEMDESVNAAHQA